MKCIAGKDCQACLEQLRENQPALVIIAGGDGTLRTAAEIFAGSETCLGIVPMGTSNNIARSLGLPLDWEPALECALHGRIEALPLAKANDRMYWNTASIGISVFIAKAVTPEAKRFIGRFAYLYTGLKRFFGHRPIHFSLQSGNTQFDYVSYQTVVTNGNFLATRKVDPDAGIRRKSLTVLAFGKDVKRRTHLKNFCLFLFGLHSHQPDALLVDAGQLNLKAEPSQPVELDGEVLTQTPVQFHILPNALRVRVPDLVE